MWLFTDVLNALLKTLLPLLSPTPTLSRSSLDPEETMDSLSLRRNEVSGHPGFRATEPFAPSTSPTSKLYSSCESVHPALSCPSTKADSLLVFCPFRAFS